MIRALTLLLLSLPASAADWYWRPYAGSTTGDGRSYATAWRGHMTARWAQMQAGDRLVICGTHTGAQAQATVTVEGLTLTGDCPGDPGVMQPSSGRAGEAINVLGVSATIERLTIRNCWSAVTVEGGAVVVRQVVVEDCGGYGVRSMNGNTSGRVEDSTFTRVGNGVYLNRGGHHDWTITGNRITDVSGTKDSHGIGMQSCSRCVVSRNWIERANSGITLYRWGDALLEDVEITGNVLRGFTGAAGSSGINRGIEVTSMNCTATPHHTRRVRIADNLITDAADAAIYVKVADQPDPQTESATVTGNTARRTAYGLRWASPNGQESGAPWFAVADNDWPGYAPPTFTPACDARNAGSTYTGQPQGC